MLYLRANNLPAFHGKISTENEGHLGVLDPDSFYSDIPNLTANLFDYRF